MSRPLGTADELERRRRRALDLLGQGQAPARVAYFLGVDRSSVYRWRLAAHTGKPGLAARPRPPRTCRLSDDQLRRLEGFLAQGAAAHGWPNGLWTASGSPPSSAATSASATTTTTSAASSASAWAGPRKSPA